MSYWVTRGFGALDVRAHDLGADGYELVIIPGTPSPPQILWGEGAELWRTVLGSAFDDSEADTATLDTLEQLESMGVLGRSDSPGTTAIPASRPWLGSFQHELVYALLNNVAARANIDIIFIKGPALHRQGLRDKEHSGDVDCWVRPGDEIALASAMRAWGWKAVRTAFDGTDIGHSQTLIPVGQWGCEIDVHTRFPGMTVDPSSAFDRVMKSSVGVIYAGVEVRTPSRPVHAVIYALHELRPVAGVRHNDAQFGRAVRAISVAGQETVDAVVDLGAGYVLESALRKSFPHMDLTQIDRRVPQDWVWRTVSSVPRRQLMALSVLPAGQRARVFLRLLWPSRETSQRVRSASESGAGMLAWVRLKRLGDGIRTLILRR